jgi:transcription antitermination protein NusB
MDDINIDKAQEYIVCNALTAADQRSLIFHLLYAAEAFDYQVSLESIIDNFSRGYNIEIPKNSDVFLQTQAIIADREKLDGYVTPLLSNWRVERLGVCTRLILRLALWELAHEKAEFAIIINEAIELAKAFAEKDAYKFVNGILDEIVKRNMLGLATSEQIKEKIV